jgi:hypothetical protein
MSRYRTTVLIGLTGLAALAAYPTIANAQQARALENAPQARPSTLPTLSELVASADLVFCGEVICVDYANSLPAPDAPDGIPYTFVTYRVNSVLHGVASDEQITLRFMGGWDPSTETYLAVSLAPQFDVGDEDILFVRGNGVSDCPLVGNRDGRLRIVDGQVYSDSGRSVKIHETGRLALGDRYSLPGVGSVDVLGHTLWTQFDPHAIVGVSDAITTEQFAGALARVAAAAELPASPFASTAFGEPFASPFPTPEPMRELVERAPDEGVIDAATMAEILSDESGLAEEFLRQLEQGEITKR